MDRKSGDALWRERVARWPSRGERVIKEIKEPFMKWEKE